MTSYRIFETEPFQKDLEHNFEGRRDKVTKKIREFVYPQLRQNPHFGSNIKKLKNYTPDTWRYRIGNYRLFYEIAEEEKVIYLLAIDSRGSSY